MSCSDQRWLHPDQDLTPETGVSFHLRYVGAVPILVSIKSVDLELRTQIAHAAIHQACSDSGLRVSCSSLVSKTISSYLGPETKQKSSLTRVRLTISLKSLTVELVDSCEVLFHHDLSMVSFASGGDTDTTDFVCYVAKNVAGDRLCYVFDCLDGLAPDVIMTLGQAFQLGFQQFKQKRSTSTSPATLNRSLDSSPSQSTRHHSASLMKQASHLTDSDHSRQRSQTHPSTRNNGTDFAPPFHHRWPSPNSNNNGHSMGTGLEDDAWLMNIPLLPPSTSENDCSTTSGPRLNYVNIPPTNAVDVEPSNIRNTHKKSSPPSRPNHSSMDRFHQLEPVGEPWYVGQMSRAEAEQLLRYEGDFLVRASPHQPGQFVLSGLQDNKCRHLLLADPNGQVRTKEHIFESIQHLIDYHVQNGIPIRSADSEIRLIFPVSANTLCEI